MDSLPEYAVLDGGMATELESRGHVSIGGDPLWSSRLLHTSPDEVVQVHNSFLEAGSDIIESNTYQASVKGFQDHLGLSESQASTLIKAGVELAVKARDDFWATCKQTERRRPLVAGSAGPYGAAQHDASEYTGNYVDKLSSEDLKNWHRPIIKLLLEGGADLLAMESIPAQKEAEAVANLLAEFPSARAWISLTCQDGEKTCHGERLIDVATNLLHCEQVIGIGVNCTAPIHIGSLLKQLHPIHSQKTIVVYPNSGEIWTPEHRWQRIQGCLPLHEYIPGWLELGAKWVGSCCRTTHQDIKHIRTAMKHVLRQA